VQEIAIRVRMDEQERLGVGEYERVVGAALTAAALVAWLPAPQERLMVRGRGVQPVRIETVSSGSGFEALIVLDDRTDATARAADAVAALVNGARGVHVENPASAAAGQIERVEGVAPRGRSAIEQALRTTVQEAHVDVAVGRTTPRVRAVSALARLAEAGAVLERVTDADADVSGSPQPGEDAAKLLGATTSGKADATKSGKDAAKKAGAKKASAKKPGKSAAKKASTNPDRG